MADRILSSRVVELSSGEIELVRAALRLLLASEEDVEEIREIKALLARLGDEAR